MVFIRDIFDLKIIGKGEYPDLNRKLTVPHTVVLPIELYSPLLVYLIYLSIAVHINYFLCWSDSNTQ